MIREFMTIPYHLKLQKKDWILLNKRYPSLQNFEFEKDKIKGEIEQAYKDYISNYSSFLISMSLERGAFFYFFCQKNKPDTILDLGSGFSSFVFRLYSKNNINSEVFTYDDSEYWLNETSKFLAKYYLSTAKMIIWEESFYKTMPNFDLAFLDIGNLDFRVRILPSLIDKIKNNNGIILVDDFHVPFYRKRIVQICTEKKVNLYSLRKVTRTRLSHNAMIIN